MCEKSPIALDHILKPREDSTPVRCVLVEGAPGIGKSTLAWEVCHKWEELESVKQYELVVLVRLREKKAQEARCLGDLLPCDATTNMKELLVIIERGKGMLIVCDGFDELPREQRQEGSVYIDLIKGRLLPEATIIVTSRPSVSTDLMSPRLCQHNIHRHLEVIGFTEGDIKQFAKSIFNGAILARFLSYITSNPPIYGMMYIPLNAVIVALIYQDNYDTDTPFPTTMAQFFDALTRALIRRHLVSTHQVPSEYCMPPSLQHTEDISKLPPLVAQQLLQLAKVAYKSLCKERYVFTDLGEDFEHLGMMKKTKSLNVCTGPGCSYSFLHLTLQEYMAALHIALMNRVLELRELVFKGGLVVRFLTGICRHDVYHSQIVYQELVQHLSKDCMMSYDLLQFVHCAYEFPSILEKFKVVRAKNTLDVKPNTGYDWYVTGCCISNFDEGWNLSIETQHMEEEFDLLLKGLRSSPIAKGKIRSLSIQSLSFSQVITPLRYFCRLHSLALHDVTLHHDDEVIIRLLTVPGSELRIIEHLSRETYTNTVYFQPSSLQVLSLGRDGYITMRTELLPQKNTNLKELGMSSNHLPPLAAFLPKITSLTQLNIFYPLDSDLPIVTNIVQSHHTLEVLVIGMVHDRKDSTETSGNLLQLIEAASKCQLKELQVSLFDYKKLPALIKNRYKHLVKHMFTSKYNRGRF